MMRIKDLIYIRNLIIINILLIFVLTLIDKNLEYKNDTGEIFERTDTIYNVTKFSVKLNDTYSNGNVFVAVKEIGGDSIKVIYVSRTPLIDDSINIIRDNKYYNQSYMVRGKINKMVFILYLIRVVIITLNLFILILILNKLIKRK